MVLMSFFSTGYRQQKNKLLKIKVIKKNPMSEKKVKSLLFMTFILRNKSFFLVRVHYITRV